MKVKFIHTLLLAAAFVSASGALVSCKDYESDDVQEMKNLNQQQYAQFESRLKALEDQVKDYSDLKARVNALRDTLNNFADTSYVNNGIREIEKAYLNTLANTVSDVKVQGTYAPAFGSLDLPGYDAKILATYYGNIAKTVDFPIAVDGVKPGTEGKIEAKEVVNNDGKVGNLGTLYVTVNPTSVDASKVTFGLESSNKDYSEDITLGEATPFAGELSFGYTRATALDGTNVWAIPATVSVDQAKALKINFNSAELKAAVKQALEDHDNDKANIKALAKAAAKFVYQNANNKAPRLGLASKYYTQIDELKFNSNVDANKSADIEVVKGETSPLKNVSELNILATAIHPLSFTVLDGSVKDNIDETVNKVIAEANKVNNATVENYLNEFSNAYAKYGDKFLDVALKPVLLLKKDGADANVKAARGAGITVEAGNYTFVPTTFTYELFAPAYKKYVSVKDPSGNEVSGENLNAVIDGSVRSINVPLTTKGAYTVLYEAVDYDGNVIAKKYTINVD